MMNLRPGALAVTLSVFVSSIAIAQSTSSNSVRLAIPGQSFESLSLFKSDSDKEREFPGTEVSINGAPSSTAEFQLRGQSCMVAKRKCFDLKLKDDGLGAEDSDEESLKTPFNGTGGLAGKNFNFVSMWLDKGYISSKIGFETFRALGIFDFRSEYAEVFINERSIGLYLVTEKPKKAIKRAVKQGKPDGAKVTFFYGRRSGGGSLEDKSDLPKKSGLTSAPFLAAYQKLKDAISQQEGEQLLTSLRQRMNLERYMQWLIVNSALVNGDYSDEVYVYADATPGQPIKFDIMPWDFDDLFKGPHPSETNKLYTNEIQTGLLYSMENPLDRKIALDPVLHRELKRVAREVLAQMTDSMIDKMINGVRSSISPYLSNSRVLNAAEYDSVKKAYTAKEINSLLSQRAKEIKNRRDLLKARAQ